MTRYGGGGRFEYERLAVLVTFTRGTDVRLMSADMSATKTIYDKNMNG